MEKGFTIIEIMVVMVIVAIIATIGFATSTNAVAKSRRANAQAMLLKVQGRQEQYYITNKGYTEDLTDLNYTASPFYIDERGELVEQSNSFYQISLESGKKPFAYTIVATAQNQQVVADNKCIVLQLLHNGSRLPSSKSDCW